MYFARHRITTNKGFFPKGKSSSKKLKWMQFRSAISILVTSLAVSSSSEHRRHLPNVKHTENWTQKEPGSFRMSQHSHSKFIGLLRQWVSNRTFMPDRFAWKVLFVKRNPYFVRPVFTLKFELEEQVKPNTSDGILSGFYVVQASRLEAWWPVDMSRFSGSWLMILVFALC